MTKLLEKMETTLRNINSKNRSAWARGVSEYTYEIMETLEEYDDDPSNAAELKERALNGAEDWKQYSWGGSSLIYDGDIAKRLCNPSELKKTKNGELRPNRNEEWLDTQARALFQAYIRVDSAYRVAKSNEN